jgi:transcriptional regulator with XRE-family HTH domain
MLPKEEIEQTLNELSAGNSDWRQRAEERRKNRSWQKLSARIAFRVLDELKHQNRTQVELAEQLGISPQAVNKWLKGKENFTLESIFKLESALGITLLSVPKRNGSVVHSKNFDAKAQTYSSTKGVAEFTQPYQKTQLRLVTAEKTA